MLLSDCLLPFLPAGAGGVIALVGAGGKTSALFGLGEELARRGPAWEVVLTTTTHLFDPRLEPGRSFDRVVLVPAWAEPAAGDEPAWDPGPARPDRGRRIVRGGRVEPSALDLRPGLP